VPHDASEKEIIMVTTKVYMTAGDETLRCDTQAGGSVGLDFEGHGFQGAGRRLALVGQSRAGSFREPACREKADDTPWNLTSRSTTF
jgi:hypothetical protein